MGSVTALMTVLDNSASPNFFRSRGRRYIRPSFSPLLF